MIQEIYIRDNSTNYMTIESEEKPGEENYQIKMLLKNSVARFLPVSIRAVNNRQIYCYDISSRQPLSRMYEGNNIKREDVKNIVMHISKIADAVKEYLLELDCVILNARFMYMNISDRSLYFTYYPYCEKPFGESLRELFEFILEHLDHNDKKAVMLTYGIYQKILQNDYNLQNLTENVEDELFEEAKGKSLQEQRENSEEKNKNRSSEHLKRNKNNFSGDIKARSVDYSNEKQEKFEKDDPQMSLRENNKGSIRKIASVMPETVMDEKEIKNSGIAAVFLAAKSFFVLVGIFTAFNMLFTEYRLIKVGLFNGMIIIAFAIAAYKVITMIYEKNKICFTRIVRNSEKIGYTVSDTEMQEEHQKINTFRSKRQIRTEPDEEYVSEKKEFRAGTIPYSDVYGHVYGHEENQMTAKKNTMVTKQEDYAQTQLLSDFLKESDTTVSCRLVAQDDFVEEKEIVIKENPFIIGSLPLNCNYSIGSKLISRMHLRLTREADSKGYFVEDLNSTNGTFVNGSRIEPNQKVQICDGDMLKIAVMQFRFWTE